MDFLSQVAMKYVHNCTIRSFCKEFENIDAVKTAIESFLPENLEKEKIQLEEEHLRIDEGENIISLQVQTTKDRHNKYILDTLLSMLSAEQKKTILSQDDRVDEKGAFYLRLDKEELIDNNTLVVVEHGNCIHFRFLLAAFPKTREKALAVRTQIFTA